MAKRRQNIRTAVEREEREERRQLLGREVEQGRRRRPTSNTLREVKREKVLSHQGRSTATQERGGRR
jgi:hypothetical protein